MTTKQTGFTLIELIIVIIILGILAVVAIPIYIDLSTDAKAAATSGVASALSGANVVNYAARSVNATYGVAITNCTSVASALQGGLPAGYTITAAAVAVGQTVNCTVTGLSGTTSTFVATGIN